MTKIKNVLGFVILGVLMYSCSSSNSTAVDDFDHEAQAIIDNDSLTKFFKNHYFDTSIDSVKSLISGQTALFDDDNLKTMNVTENEIDYTLYYYVNRVGTPDPEKGFPTVMDSIFVKYYGQRIVNTSSISTSFDSNTSGIWFTLNSVIRGASILSNENLLFYIDLYDLVENTDHDNDGVASIFEDPDGDGDPRNDDTDGDNIPNYIDIDDDGDGVLTKDEDTNNDGDPSNDFTDGSTVPNYLDADVK